jgi:Phage capsid protein
VSDTAFITQYRAEFIHGFEDRQSRLKNACIPEGMVKGNTATFLVADSGAATATTRGVNGLIPARPDNLNQFSATVLEWHDLVRKTGFNVFASQGDQRRVMQETSMAVINRKIDDDIIAQLDTATNHAGATGVVASLNLVVRARTILGNNFVPIEEEDNMFGVVTPAFMGYLLQIKEFAHAAYVDVKPFNGPAQRYRRWAGVNWIEHPRLTGVGTATEQCYMFHRNALGHAVDKASVQSPVGYNEEQDYSWARVSVYMGSKLLQQSGVVMMRHDGSAYVAT